MTQEKRIYYLQNKLRELSEENAKLKQEAQIMESKYEQRELNLQKREEAVLEMESTFKSVLSELSDIKEKYLSALKEFSELRANYQKDIKAEIQRVRHIA